MQAIDCIRKKRDGNSLTKDEIESFVTGATSGDWSDYQVSALLMAIFIRGMTEEETAWLTAAMVHSGEKLDLSGIPGYKVDKHSSGGVGDKTSLILAPLAAACGCIIPMMSGRGLGHTGGTLDKLESISGFRVRLSIEELRQALEKVGCALIGQTAEIAPADRLLYSLRDVTATVESIPLITSSIMSKKIAEGIQGLVLDVKCGKGAFMKSKKSATSLAHSLVATGKANGVETVAYITDMDAPLGKAVGHSHEVIESIEVLKGNGPKKLEDLSVLLAAKMVHLSDPQTSLAQAETKVREALSSGKGLEKFAEIIENQGGDAKVIEDYSRFPKAAKRHSFLSKAPGHISDIHAELVGRANMKLGGGRNRVEDQIDHSVGILVKAQVGQYVEKDEVLAEVHYRQEDHLKGCIDLLDAAFDFSQEEIEEPSFILDEIH